jgi:hypothetical protein
LSGAKRAAAVVSGLVLTIALAGCGSTAKVKTQVEAFKKDEVSSCTKLNAKSAGQRIYDCRFANGDHGCYTVDEQASPSVTEVFGAAGCPFEPAESEVPGSSD